MRWINLRKEDATDSCRWREGVGRIAEVVGCIRAPLFTEDIYLNWIKIVLMIDDDYGLLLFFSRSPKKNAVIEPLLPRFKICNIKLPDSENFRRK